MDKEIRDLKRRLSYGLIEGKMRDEKVLKNLHIQAKISTESYKKGEAWYKSGLSLDDAPEEFKEDYSFVYGFEHGKRLSLIQEIQNASSSKKSR